VEELLFRECDPPVSFFFFCRFKLDQALELTSLELKRKAIYPGRASLEGATVPGNDLAAVSRNRTAVIEVFQAVILQETCCRSEARPGGFIHCPGEQDSLDLEHHVPVGGAITSSRELVMKNDVVGHGIPR